MKKLILITLFFPLCGWAWGLRGHHTICEAASHLVKEKNLKEFLNSRAHVMGHLCNIPDTHWRNISPEATTQGAATHYVDMDILPIAGSEIPLDYKKIIETYTGQKNVITGSTIYSIPADFGSNWWRADQFYRGAVESGKLAQNYAAPTNSQEQQDETLPFNKFILSFYTNLGLMGHFVGDNAQPYHLVADYDGYLSNRGGIHSYYEEALVSVLPVQLTSKVVESAKKNQEKLVSKNKADLKQISFLTEKSVVGKMRALGQASLAEIPKIIALDKVIKPSVKKSEKGMSLKTPAERVPAETVVGKFEPLIIGQMARAAALLAQLWDEAYAEAGKPELKEYKSYLYPFTPDFVPPDYFDLKLLQKKGN
jgi:hypothetical protein